MTTSPPAEPMASAPLFSVGLTGGIGSGKSTVAELFAARGASVVDTDRIAHQLTGAGGAAMPALLDAFGERCADAAGALDRAGMRALVFGDAAAKARLEAILHPLIRAAALAEARAARGSYVMFAVPLLVESPGWRERVTRVLVVDCAERLQVARVTARNGLSEAQVHAIMATQASREERRAAADDMILNDAGRDALLPQIDRLHKRYLQLYSELAIISSQRL